MSPVSRTEALAMFHEAARTMWRNVEPVLKRTTASDEEPAGGFLASLAHPPGAVWRIGPMLQATARCGFTLRIASRLLDLGPDAVRRIMIHEACHLGIGGHGEEFRALCRKHGGAVSEEALLGGDVVRVQQLVRRRYRTVREFPGSQEQEACVWGREQSRQNPGERFRVAM
jgi:hypothetical protein